MGSGISRILPGLYVGSLRDANNREALDKLKITHIVSVHDRASDIYPDLVNLCLQLSDTPETSISDFFLPVARFIHTARRQDGSVLVHCMAGVSRSVAIVTAYVMLVGEVGWIDGLKVVRSGRREANPNTGFKRQLREFQTRIGDDRALFREEFSKDADLYDDVAECQKLIEEYLKRLDFGERLMNEQDALLIESLQNRLEEKSIEAAYDDDIIFADAEDLESSPNDKSSQKTAPNHESSPKSCQTKPQPLKISPCSGTDQSENDDQCANNIDSVAQRTVEIVSTKTNNDVNSQSINGFSQEDGCDSREISSKPVDL